MGTRYFYYILLQNMVLNVIVFVPHTLISHRFDGAVMAVLISIPISVTMLALCMRSLSRVQDKSVTDVLMAALPKWLASILVTYFAMFWFLAGAITLLSYSEITERYALPETPRWQITGLFVFLVVYAGRMKSKTILRGLEVMFLINSPLVAIMVLKSLFSDEFNWWAVMDIITHSLHVPDVKSISAATFIFTGYTGMMIFNPLIKTNINNMKHYLLIALMGLVTLLTSFLIPIGFHGTNAVAHYIFPWVISADSMRLQYFIIERVLFIFLLLYLSIVLLSSVFQWHVGAELMHTIIPKKRVKDITMIVFVAGIFVMGRLLRDQFDLTQFAEYWVMLRFFSEIGFVAIVIFSVRRIKNQT